MAIIIYFSWDMKSVNLKSPFWWLRVFLGISWWKAISWQKSIKKISNVVVFKRRWADSPIDLAILFHTDYEMCSLLKSSTIKCEHNVFFINIWFYKLQAPGCLLMFFFSFKNEIVVLHLFYVYQVLIWQSNSWQH